MRALRLGVGVRIASAEPASVGADPAGTPALILGVDTLVEFLFLTQTTLSLLQPLDMPAWDLLGFGFALIVQHPSCGRQAFAAITAGAQLGRQLIATRVAEALILATIYLLGLLEQLPRDLLVSDEHESSQCRLATRSLTPGAKRASRRPRPGRSGIVQGASHVRAW